jgi:hypothetical protein
VKGQIAERQQSAHAMSSSAMSALFGVPKMVPG